MNSINSEALRGLASLWPVSVFDEVQLAAVGHIFRVVDGVALEPWLDESGLGVLVDGGDGGLIQQDRLRLAKQLAAAGGILSAGRLCQ